MVFFKHFCLKFQYFPRGFDKRADFFFKSQHTVKSKHRKIVLNLWICFWITWGSFKTTDIQTQPRSNESEPESGVIECFKRSSGGCKVKKKDQINENHWFYQDRELARASWPAAWWVFVLEQRLWCPLLDQGN